MKLAERGASAAGGVEQRISPLVAEAVALGVDASWVRHAIAETIRCCADGLGGVDRAQERFHAGPAGRDTRHDGFPGRWLAWSHAYVSPVRLQSAGRGPDGMHGGAGCWSARRGWTSAKGLWK